MENPQSPIKSETLDKLNSKLEVSDGMKRNIPHTLIKSEIPLMIESVLQYLCMILVTHILNNTLA